MALQLSISLTQASDCSTLEINDITGVYSTSNTTGWSHNGSGSVDAANITVDSGVIDTATITLTSPAGAVATFDLLDADTWTALTGFAGEPFNTGTNPSTLSYTITPTLLGFTTSDGVWQVYYYVKDVYGRQASITRSFAIFYAVEHCVNRLIARIPSHYTCDQCNNTFVANVVVVRGLMEALKYAANNALLTKFDSILESIRDICELFDEECIC